MPSSLPTSVEFSPLSDPIRLGVIGFGNHVVKNMLRLFDGVSGPDLRRVLVRDPVRYRERHAALADRFTGDLDAVLGDPGIEAIYIATPISSHFDYARKALLAGKHVWCEKPLTHALASTAELVGLAAEKGLMLGEVSAYRHHRQFAWIRELLATKARAGERLIDMRARFSIPELPAADIRYSKELCGGALLDVGYYPLSLAVALFGTPQRLTAVGHVDPKLQVDLSGSALLAYDGFASHCTWAIGSAYANELELSFTRSTFVVARAFSKPPTLALEIQFISADGSKGEPIRIPADDQFANLFAHFAGLIRSGDPQVFRREREHALATAGVLESVQLAVLAP
jgi:dTDP-3,4-didehydro-2,6-dideoxy-alpha-D-glucose 3-reductase